MNASVLPVADRVLVLRACLAEMRTECLRMWRQPAFSLPSILFPVMFYVLFAVLLPGGAGAPQVATMFLATYGIFGAMGVALFGFGAVVAEERDRGQLALKRALPMPPAAWVLAKLAMAMFFVTIITLLLDLAAATGGVRLAAGQYALLWSVNLLTVLPFGALGLWLGARLSGAAAMAVVNLIFLPLAFLSGLWMPLSMLPDLFTTLAPAWPSWHLAQIALRAIGMGTATQPLAVHLAVVFASFAAFSFLALRCLAAR